MKKRFVFLAFYILLSPFSFSQKFVDFTITEPNKGTGTFSDATLPDFTWEATGTLNQNVQIKNNETFDDGNQFEASYGQANNAENLRIQAATNGTGTVGQPIVSKVSLTVTFDKFAPANCWGFCLTDIDVENALISANDINGEEISNSVIDSWLIELFDTNLEEDGVNIPKWDSTHAAILGSDTPGEYVAYDSIVIGGMASDEAGAAYFKPNTPIKSLTVTFENLQDVYATSYHFYVASDDDKTFVPDDNFEQALIDQGYDNQPLNDLVSTTNIIGIKNLSVSGKNISDMTGIEDFTALEDFRCHINKITELDVSKNSQLKILDADDNNLTVLDVSQNPNLESFSVSDNNFTEIDVSNNPDLRSLYFYNNKVTNP